MDVFGSKKMAIGFYSLMSIGILFYGYDFFGVTPMNDFSKTFYFHIGGLLFWIPAMNLTTDIWMKFVMHRQIKNDQTITIVDDSSKKIIIGTSVGLGLLIIVLLAIILPATSNPNSGSITPEFNLGYFHHPEIIKYGGLVILTTHFYNIPVEPFEPSKGDYIVIGLSSKNNYYKQNVTYMPDKFTLIDENGIEYENVIRSSDEIHDLSDFKEIMPRDSVQKQLTFETHYDSELKYELKIDNIGLVCMQNCT